MQTKKKKTSSINSPTNVEPGCSKNTKNGDLKILFYINYCKKFRSKMITMIKKYGDQPVSLGNRESYYVGFNTTYPQKQGKTKQ